MNKKRWFIFYLLFTLTITCLYFGYLYMYRAEFLSNIVSRALRTPVKVDEMTIGHNELILSNFRIQNPQGCEVKKAFSVKEALFRISWLDALFSIIFDRPIVIDEVLIDHPTIGLELFNFSGSDNNWKRLIDRIPDEPEEKKKDDLKFIVEKIILTDIHIEMLNHSVSGTTITPPPLPYLRIEGLGHDEPLTSNEIYLDSFAIILGELSTDLKIRELTAGIKHFPGAITRRVLSLPGQVTGTVINTLHTTIKTITNTFKALVTPDSGTESPSGANEGPP